MCQRCASDMPYDDGLRCVAFPSRQAFVGCCWSGVGASAQFSGKSSRLLSEVCSVIFLTLSHSTRAGLAAFSIEGDSLLGTAGILARIRA